MGIVNRIFKPKFVQKHIGIKANRTIAASILVHVRREYFGKQTTG